MNQQLYTILRATTEGPVFADLVENAPKGAVLPEEDHAPSPREPGEELVREPRQRPGTLQESANPL